ncbi:MAG: hypothetical protein Q6J33_05370, partial [Gloeomargarita sp. DG_2_bins_126]
MTWTFRQESSRNLTNGGRYNQEGRHQRGKAMLNRRQVLWGGLGLTLLGAKAAWADSYPVELTARFSVP